MEEKMKLTGHIKFDLYNDKGELKDQREIHNVVVTVGKSYLANWLTAATQSDYFMRYLALGQGTTPATAGDTALDSTLPTRVAGTLSNAANVWQNQGTFGPGVNTGAVTEAGIFDLSSGGTMLARQVFAVINKDTNDSLQVTWQITIS